MQSAICIMLKLEIFLLFFVISGSLSVQNRYYNSLLSDFLRINYDFKDNVTVSLACRQQLNEVQNAMNAKDVWAIKRK